MLTKLSLIAATAMLAMLAGCASTYVPPASGPIAQVRLVHAGAGYYSYAFLQGRESDSCNAEKVTLGGVGGVGAERTEPIGMPAAEPLAKGTFIEQKIRAGQPYTVTVNASLVNRTCQISGTFLPEPGANYQFGLSVGMQGCSLIPSKLVQDDKGVVTAEIMRSMQFKNCR